MGTIQTPLAAWAELSEISRHDRVRFVKEASRLRAAQFDGLFAAATRSLAWLGRAVVRPAMRGRAQSTHAG